MGETMQTEKDNLKKPRTNTKDRFKKRKEEFVNPYTEKVIKINRVTKVCKGGKRLAFRAVVIVGDQDGKVSVSLGKSKEVPSAIKKAIEKGKKSLETVVIADGTLPHEVIGEFGASRVLMRPAPEGTGVIAGGAVRVILEAAGFKNVVAKSLGSNNAVNSARAALDGLLRLSSKETLKNVRGVVIKKRG